MSAFFHPFLKKYVKVSTKSFIIIEPNQIPQNWQIINFHKMRYFENPYEDYNNSTAVHVDKDKIKSLIQRYLKDIFKSNYEDGNNFKIL